VEQMTDDERMFKVGYVIKYKDFKLEACKSVTGQYVGLRLGLDKYTFMGSTLEKLTTRFVNYIDERSEGEYPNLIAYRGYALPLCYWEDVIVGSCFCCLPNIQAPTLDEIRQIFKNHVDTYLAS
jgi:hypothetical protein